MNRSILLASALALLPACPLVDVEVDLSEACVTYDETKIDAVPVEAGVIARATIHRSFTIDDLSAFHRITDQDAEASFVRGEILALSGVDDFSFVEAARIVISSGDPESDLPPLLVYECDGDCVAEGGTLDMTAGAAHDVVDYLRGDSLVVDLELTGRPPTTAWSMRSELCFAANARYTY